MANKQGGRRVVPPSMRAVWSDFCAVAPSPELRERWLADLAEARENSTSPLAQLFGLARAPRRLGFDDGVIIPPDQFPLGTPLGAIRAAAADRAPLRGAVRVIVVLAQFSDHAMVQAAPHFRDLFFSSGVLPHGSVKEYFKEASGALVDLVGEVVGPFQLPQTLAFYANNHFGIGRPTGTARANIMANDAAVAANRTVNFAQYDNDGNGFVDAFIVVHAGGGGEQTGNSNDIWSHKSVLASPLSADGTQIFAYLTIPEDARIGVCAHELGHLLFGLPDLYDTDETSEGVGNWCLMGGGSWNGGGDIPAHPSAWCKVQQGWASVTNITTSGTISIPDVKTSRNVHRLWKGGTGGPEYFLIENRQRNHYDANLPGDGLLIWHIDEAQTENTDENHFKVGLLQADAKRDLELKKNRGDAGDPYPGSAANTALNANSTPNSKSFAGQDTSVAVSAISASGATMTAVVSVQPGKSRIKDNKDQFDKGKELAKESKENKDRKDILKEGKEGKESKELAKESKENKDRKDIVKEAKEGKDGKELAKERKDQKDIFEFTGTVPGGAGAAPASPDIGQALAELQARVAALEDAVALSANAQPFIGSELRPDLIGGPDYSEAGDLQARMAAGDRDAKLSYDSLPPA
jgi:immune inhibitor A